MNRSVYIIAEAGINHNGSLSRAKELIDCAAEEQADAVKFQSFRTELLVSRTAPKAEYQAVNDEGSSTQFDMLKEVELSEDSHHELEEHARKRGVQFLSTPFETTSLKFLTEKLGMETIKVPSGELTNGPFLLEVARKAKSIILSTGMGNLDEIRMALKLIAYGFSEVSERVPGFDLLEELTAEQLDCLRERVTILHATTEYPAAMADINLRAMKSIQDRFGLPVGYSDHSPGIIVPIAATALGASVIEKHFTLDKTLPGPDHKASLDPKELKQMVRAIRDTELALGDGEKRPAESEKKNMPIARKSLHASRPIEKGEAFTAENLSIKRPGNGVSPLKYWEYLGNPASQDYQTDELINE